MIKTNEIGVSEVELPAAISNLNLSMIRKKLMEPAPEGKGWNQSQVKEAELWYKRYLFLCLKYGQEIVVPNYPIDTFWHQHILDTRAYYTDCLSIFGELLHHYPYFGLNDDKDDLAEAYNKTLQLYRVEFGCDCSQMKENYYYETKGAMGCGDKGSGTGCKQGCGKK